MSWRGVAWLGWLTLRRCVIGRICFGAFVRVRVVLLGWLELTETR